MPKRHVSWLRGHLGQAARLVLGLALVVLSAPRLWAVFEEAEKPNLLKAKQFLVSVECRRPVAAFVRVDVRNDGSADYKLMLEFAQPQVEASDCTRIDLAVPGTIVDVKGGSAGGKEPAWLYAKPAFGLRVSDPTVTLMDRGERTDKDYDAAALTLHFDARGYRTIAITGHDEAFLIERTFTSRMLNLTLDCEGNLFSQSPDIAACTSNGVVVLEDAWQVGTDFTSLAISMDETGKSHLELSKAEAGTKSATVAVDNLRRARIRDLQIVFTGTLLATGIAILADFVIELFAAAGEAGKPRDPLTRRERALRRLAWRAARARRRRR